MKNKNEPLCYGCVNYFESYFCGYNESRCKVHGYLDVGQNERHPDTAAASCPNYAPKPPEAKKEKTWQGKPGRCRGCGAWIKWFTTTAGKAMPCDDKPVLYKVKIGGPQKIVTPYGDVISCEIVEDRKIADGQGYVPHWSTCPNANDFRKKVKK